MTKQEEEEEGKDPMTADEAPKLPTSRRLPLAIAAGTAGIVVIGVLLVARASSRVNDVALASTPKPVTVVAERVTTPRPPQR